jgi:hypothetical protein
MNNPSVPSNTDGPIYEVISVTPELAEQWLANNTHNRNLREQAVLGYARDMEAGRWAENGESIKFATDGTLLDGQHRLTALTLAKVTLPMLVVTGLEARAQETMDDGRKRTTADVLTLRGESNSVTTAAVARRAYMWTQGTYSKSGYIRPTNQEVLNFFNEHPEIRRSAQLAVQVRNANPLPASVAGLTHWLFSQIDTSDAAEFFHLLISGAIVPETHPVLVLRKRIQTEAAKPGRVDEDHMLAFVIKAWNAYRAGEQISFLRYKPGGANPEKFPMPK